MCTARRKDGRLGYQIRRPGRGAEESKRATESGERQVEMREEIQRASELTSVQEESMLLTSLQSSCLHCSCTIFCYYEIRMEAINVVDLFSHLIRFHNSAPNFKIKIQI